MSALALLKMAIHARSGGSLEVMGLMQGKVQGDTFIVIDSFALPVEGTETRVNAQVRRAAGGVGAAGGGARGWGWAALALFACLRRSEPQRALRLCRCSHRSCSFAARLGLMDSRCDDRPPPHPTHTPRCNPITGTHAPRCRSNNTGGGVRVYGGLCGQHEERGAA